MTFIQLAAIVSALRQQSPTRFDKIAVLQLCEDGLMVSNLPLLLEKVDLDVKNKLCSIYWINVSSKLGQPCRCTQHFLTSVNSKLQKLQHHLKVCCGGTFESASETGPRTPLAAPAIAVPPSIREIPVSVSLVQLRLGLALPTLAGYLLEYPVVYCWEKDIGLNSGASTIELEEEEPSMEGNCLGGVPLILYSMQTKRCARR
jgi:hypothetical protein